LVNLKVGQVRNGSRLLRCFIPLVTLLLQVAVAVVVETAAAGVQADCFLVLAL
jgi:hypothetical protein